MEDANDTFFVDAARLRRGRNRTLEAQRGQRVGRGGALSHLLQYPTPETHVTALPDMQDL